jgi:hypothetical protein
VTLRPFTQGLGSVGVFASRAFVFALLLRFGPHAPWLAHAGCSRTMPPGSPRTPPWSFWASRVSSWIEDLGALGPVALIASPAHGRHLSASRLIERRVES